MKDISPHIRFREARERLGLLPDEVAARSGVRDAGVWDIEAHKDELTCCYSAKDIQRFCQILKIHPVQLFGSDISESAISASDLVKRINAECRSRSITLEQFEDAVGWRLSQCIDPPDQLLEDMTIDGLQWLCRELQIDWRRVLLSL